MATLVPFRALRPTPADAARIAAVPYDVVTTDEARVLADGNPLSFLRVSRAELELPPSTDPYSEAVYRRSADNFDKLKRASLIVEDESTVYLYRLRTGSHEQTGVAACFSIEEYDRGVIRRHERTRRDKEDDRTRHMLALGAQTGPVFLIYPALAPVDSLVSRVTTRQPLFDFDAPDGVRHTVWKAGGRDREALVELFSDVPALYIADGHHRAASAARAREVILRGGASPGGAAPRTILGDGADASTMLAVAFPHSQTQILPYNRVVKDLAGLSPQQFLAQVRERFTIAPGTATPSRRGEVAMCLPDGWYTLRPCVAPERADRIASLDVSMLQDQLLAPVLKIADVRTDKRIDFVGGARGTAALEEAVNSGAAAVAFSLYPVSVTDLMAVSDAGGIMPPKSTWFEPKLRDGLLIHLI
jgi:uncharacterized protein (DUF1015 family)